MIRKFDFSPKDLVTAAVKHLVESGLIDESDEGNAQVNIRINNSDPANIQIEVFEVYIPDPRDDRFSK